MIVPDVQRSWISKAHLVGETVTTREYWPEDVIPPQDNNTTSSSSSTSPTPHPASPQNGNGSAARQTRPWILVSSTPASCTQLGLNHLFLPSSTSTASNNSSGGSDKEETNLPPIDLVISGPNYGRNTTAVFALSSGTLGAALEAAVCGYRSIALSFAFFDRENVPSIVAQSCAHAVKVVEHVFAVGDWSARKAAFIPDRNTQEGQDKEEGSRDTRDNHSSRVFSINVPVKDGVGKEKVLWTRCLANQWRTGSCFDEDDGAASTTTTTSSASGNTRRFHWAPKFTDVYNSVLAAGPGSDGWAVKEGQTSVTALRANFMHDDSFTGEVKL